MENVNNNGGVDVNLLDILFSAPGPDDVVVDETPAINPDANPCPRCGGSGDIGRVTILGHSTCLRCNGTGVDSGGNIGAAIRRAETH